MNRWPDSSMPQTLECSKKQLSLFWTKYLSSKSNKLKKSWTKFRLKNFWTCTFLSSFATTQSITLKICISRRVKSMKTFFKIFSTIVLTFKKNSVSRNLNLKIWKNKCSLKKCSKRRKIDRPWNRWRKRTKRKVFKFKLTITWKTKVISQS